MADPTSLEPYATTAELVTFTGQDAPEGATRLLDRASELISDATRSACYQVDDYGNPTDSDDIAAFRDATCAQVEFWMAGDEEDDVLGPLDAYTLGGMSVTAKAKTIAPRAARILRQAMLYGGAPVVP